MLQTDSYKPFLNVFSEVVFLLLLLATPVVRVSRDEPLSPASEVANEESLTIASRKGLELLSDVSGCSFIAVLGQKPRSMSVAAFHVLIRRNNNTKANPIFFRLSS